MTSAAILSALRDAALSQGLLTNQQWADHAGIKRQQLEAYLSGKVDPRLKTLIRLAESVGIEIKV